MKKKNSGKCRHGEWDEDGFVLPAELSLDSNSALEDALLVFYSAGGLDFFNVENPNLYAEKWLDFISGLYCVIDDGEFAPRGGSFKIPLSAEQKHELYERGVPAIFLTDLG